MDRGRAGGFITDNNYHGLMMKKKQREEHTHRLEKIMARKPGTSDTLDNRPPNVIKALLDDPRKRALKEYFYFVTERENKSLLKRISDILTAQPNVDQEHYEQLKKLCQSHAEDPKQKFEQTLVKKRTKIFFKNLKNTGAYYNVKKWEEDYQRQLYHQRFMRQVKYRRPPNFVDPFLAKEKNDKNESDMKNRNSKSGNLKPLNSTLNTPTTSSPPTTGMTENSEQFKSLDESVNTGRTKTRSSSTSSAHIHRIKARKSQNKQNNLMQKIDLAPLSHSASSFNDSQVTSATPQKRVYKNAKKSSSPTIMRTIKPNRNRVSFNEKSDNDYSDDYEDDIEENEDYYADEFEEVGRNKSPIQNTKPMSQGKSKRSHHSLHNSSESLYTQHEEYDHRDIVDEHDEYDNEGDDDFYDDDDGGISNEDGAELEEERVELLSSERPLRIVKEILVRKEHSRSSSVNGSFNRGTSDGTGSEISESEYPLGGIDQSLSNALAGVQEDDQDKGNSPQDHQQMHANTIPKGWTVTEDNFLLNAKVEAYLIPDQEIVVISAVVLDAANNSSQRKHEGEVVQSPSNKSNDDNEDAKSKSEDHGLGLIEAEAEISVADLALLGDLPPELVDRLPLLVSHRPQHHSHPKKNKFDATTRHQSKGVLMMQHEHEQQQHYEELLEILRDLAKEISENVEIKIAWEYNHKRRDEDHAGNHTSEEDKRSMIRLILNLSQMNSDGGDGTGLSNDPKKNFHDKNNDLIPVNGLLSSNASKDFYQLFSSNFINGLTTTNEQEVMDVLLKDTDTVILKTGAMLNIVFPIKDPTNINSLVGLAKKNAKNDSVYSLLKVVSTLEEQLMVVAFIINNSTTMFKKGNRYSRPAVMSGLSLRYYTVLPSVVFADSEIISSYAENLIKNLRIEHDSKSGENKLIVMNDVPIT